MTEKYSLQYLNLLSKEYPSLSSASNEIIHLQSILNLPKGTEHFMSDVHGEYEAFVHIVNSASGAVREKVDILFENVMTKEERARLATLIYYPEKKLEEINENLREPHEWYRLTLNRLVELSRFIASKYTRSKVRKAFNPKYSSIMDELLNTNYDLTDKKDYYDNIILSIIETDSGDKYIIALCTVIKKLIVDHLHIVGDVFDRGPRADVIMNQLINHHSVDIQWGNHDVLWMGAATGSRTCIATVLCNSIIYNNLEVIETGYGISLRPLALFANEMYMDTDLSCFGVRSFGGDGQAKDMALASRMYKAIAVILFKLEGQIILRNPSFNMEDRLLLDKIDYKNNSIEIGSKTYQLLDTDFPTIDRENPYKLSPEEAELMAQLKGSFIHSEKLQRHVRFLYTKGNLYKCYNGNLLFHGCIPMNSDGSLMEFTIDGEVLKGKDFLDRAEVIARQGYYAKEGTAERQTGKDFLWFLWCGRNSPIFGRDHIATFERRLIADKEVWIEPKNPYYDFYTDPSVCEYLLKEFGLVGDHCHIINGHVPVRLKDGENPVKAGGKLIVIDGGFCRAYQPTTGIAGYTLVYNSWGIRISAHEPFAGQKDAIKNNRDIHSSSTIFDRMESRIKISETDKGAEIKETIDSLKELVKAYKQGLITEKVD